MNRAPRLAYDADEFDLIFQIASRSNVLLKKHGIEEEMLTTVMDISTAHEHGPLHLEEFLAADDSNFAHDALGIRRHINRKTGMLEDCFLPRFAILD